MSGAEFVKDSENMNCLCFANLDWKCSCRAGCSTSHLLMKKLEEIICISPGFPCTESFQREVLWLHITFYNISPSFPLRSLQSQLDCWMLFYIWVLDLRRVWSRAFPSSGRQTNLDEMFWRLQKSEEKKKVFMG